MSSFQKKEKKNQTKNSHLSGTSTLRKLGKIKKLAESGHIQEITSSRIKSKWTFSREGHENATGKKDPYFQKKMQGGNSTCGIEKSQDVWEPEDAPGKSPRSVRKPSDNGKNRGRGTGEILQLTQYCRSSFISPSHGNHRGSGVAETRGGGIQGGKVQGAQKSGEGPFAHKICAQGRL